MPGYADLRNALAPGNAEGVSFRYTDLRGADLPKAENIDKARFRDAKYDEATRWNLDPAAGTVLVKAEPTTAAATGAAGTANPLVGKWIILKERGATEAGVLKIKSDGTCK